ncbi:hypothetical protein OS493_027837 [Desmophyllum pertusum]|uniref:Uncharacterized protein n=1 Tax=Desmophyllum pertusum TaxID=174260 RepID=A0A9W9YX36_9CNID|nr:hypothetical protein OS493_027837 [Desmophyllum pertusum]
MDVVVLVKKRRRHAMNGGSPREGQRSFINWQQTDKDSEIPVRNYAIMNGQHGVAEHLKARGGTFSECKLAHLMTSAASTGDTRILKRLIRWTGGNVNVSDFDGQTPLHTAAMYGRLNVVNLLLKEGADVTLVNRYGQIPLQVAVANNHTAVEKELRKFLKLTEEILLADHFTATCYSPQARKRSRKHRTEPSQYNYSKRESWTSTENSLDIHRQRGLSVNSIHASREIINLANMRAPLEENDSSRPSFLHASTHAISNLTPQAREMAGGQPDYV